MSRGNLSRRGFLERSLAGLTIGAGLLVWYAQEIIAQERAQAQPRPAGANERIVMGAIGVGGRGTVIMNDARRQTGVQMVAVCEVDAERRNRAATQVGGNCARHGDFRELLQNRNINAVTIGTPDHWHVMIAIAALRAGKDVYCEKPLTLTIDEGKALVRAVRETNRIFQVGSQQRSSANFRLACELVRNGRLGRIQAIETHIGENTTGGPFATAAVPAGLDWNFWQGQTPQVDFVPQRCHHSFRWWYEYSGGKMTDWGAHHNDIAQWALGMDTSGPAEIRALQATAPSRERNSYNIHSTFEVHLTYANGPEGANGTILKCMSRGENGVRFEGEDGKWIFVSRSRIAAGRGTQTDRSILNDPLPRDAVRLPVSTNHMANFVESVRHRRPPICTAEVGHRSASVCHLANIALRMSQTYPGQIMRWNPREERFVDNDDANRWLSRPLRAPWAEEWRRLTAVSS
jgi:predicted dehydrogenase